MTNNTTTNWLVFKKISYVILVVLSPKILGAYSIGLAVCIVLGITLTPSTSVNSYDKTIGISLILILFGFSYWGWSNISLNLLYVFNILFFIGGIIFAFYLYDRLGISFIVALIYSFIIFGIGYLIVVGFNPFINGFGGTSASEHEYLH